MKTWTKMMTIAAIAMTTLTLQAQTHSAASAMVPFDFQVSGRSMPAGQYFISRTATGTYTIENTKTKRASLFQAPLRSPAQSGAGKLTFRCYSEACEIESVTFSGDANTNTRAFNSNKRNPIGFTAASVNLTRD